MYLLDTNIWLELLLEQERSDDVKKFLESVNVNVISISEFSIYSIGIILIKLEKLDLYKDFINDIFQSSAVNRVILDENDLIELTDTCEKYSLDFDDAYQYTSAKKYNYSLVSYDTDFDKTDISRLTPDDIIHS